MSKRPAHLPSQSSAARESVEANDRPDNLVGQVAQIVWANWSLVSKSRGAVLVRSGTSVAAVADGGISMPRNYQHGRKHEDRTVSTSKDGDQPEYIKSINIRRAAEGHVSRDSRRGTAPCRRLLGGRLR